MHAAVGDPGMDADRHDVVVAPVQRQDLERIFASYLDPVYLFLYKRVGNREDAEDLTSQVFLKASRQLDGARSEASVASWLFTVARTILADHWRRYYRTPLIVELHDEMIVDHAQREAGDGRTQSAEQLVERVLTTLPPRYRCVLELRFLHGYSVDEAAREMEVTTGNLKVLQHRALARAAAIGLQGREGRVLLRYRSTLEAV